jgi:phage-related protein
MAKAKKCKKIVKFSNAQSKKSFEKLPKKISESFSSELEDIVAYGLDPTIGWDSLGEKIIELKINGSPAYRCAYKVLDDVVIVLHSFIKTSEGPDKKNMKTLKSRLKSLDSAQFC